MAIFCGLFIDFVAIMKSAKVCTAYLRKSNWKVGSLFVVQNSVKNNNQLIGWSVAFLKIQFLSCS